MPLNQPCIATCIDHLTIWDPRHLSDRIGDIVTLSTSFLDHKGVLGTIHFPVLTEKATAPPPAKTLRVATLLFLVPEHVMETWHSNVAVDSSAVIALLSAMARSLLDCLSCDLNQGREDPSPNPHGMESAIFSIPNDLQTIMGGAMPTATAIFP